MIQLIKGTLPILISYAAMTVYGFAQRSGAPTSSPPQPVTVLHATTRLVQVNAIALDNYNQPVSDLAARDFVLTDNGTRQKISIFSLQKSESSAGPVRALPPNTFSNRWEDRPDVPTSVTVILLDAVNTKVADQAYSRQQVERFLKQVHPQDRVAIYTLGEKLALLHDFSNDDNSLAAAVAGYKGEVPIELNEGDAAVASALNPLVLDPVSPESTALPRQNSMNAVYGRARTDTQNHSIESQLDFLTLRRAAKT
jgi:VWFA-related protein